jgi:hypothetical protein
MVRAWRLRGILCFSALLCACGDEESAAELQIGTWALLGAEISPGAP